MTFTIRGRMRELEGTLSKESVHGKGCGFDNWRAEYVARLEGELKALKEAAEAVEKKKRLALSIRFDTFNDGWNAAIKEILGAEGERT